MLRIEPATESDFEAIYRVINDAAMAYKGVIPADRWQDPYMPRAELRQHVEEGERFSCCWEDADVVGVMAIQDKGEVFLVRHAYVCTSHRNQGIGTRLLHELTSGLARPVLVGTWKAAEWAIRFYSRNGYHVVPQGDAEVLLGKYWRIPRRQLETSVVLADARYEKTRERLLAGNPK